MWVFDDGINQEPCKCGKWLELPTDIERLQGCAVVLIADPWRMGKISNPTPSKKKGKAYCKQPEELAEQTSLVWLDPSVGMVEGER